MDFILFFIGFISGGIIVFFDCRNRKKDAEKALLTKLNIEREAVQTLEQVIREQTKTMAEGGLI